jgi:Copper binding proteins, plastocyanin/azurin family
MTDTTTLDETTDSDELPGLVESVAFGADGTAPESPLKTRFLLPLLVPLFSIVIVAVLVLNISRVFLAGNKDAALVVGIVITLSILVGASLIAAAPRLRTSSLVMILAGVLVLVSGAGLVSLGPSLNDSGGGTTGFQYATGKPAGTVSVLAGPGLTFNGAASTGKYTAPSGVVQIDYGGDSGHTLAIQDPKFDGFLLSSSPGGRKSGKVQLNPGTYTIYCTVPGHEAAGMKATLTVSK